MSKDKEESVKSPAVEENLDSNESSVQKRRSVLKGALLGTGSAAALPDAWINPVINTVIIPAHAETTDGSDTDPGDATTAPSTDEPASTCPGTLVESPGGGCGLPTAPALKF